MNSTNERISRIIIVTACIMFFVSSYQVFNYTMAETQSISGYDFIFNRNCYQLEEVDRIWFVFVGYNSLATDVNHKIIVSDTPTMDTLSYTEWQNYTLTSDYHKNVEFNIPSTVIKPNSTIYYRVEIENKNGSPLYKSEVKSFVNVVNVDSPSLSQMVKSGEERGYDFPWNWCHEVIWDENTQQFWFLSSGEKELTKKAWISTKPYDWTFAGNVSTEFPEGWSSHKGVSGFILDEDSYFASINIHDEDGTGAVLYSGDSFVNMTYEGILFIYGENENCTVNSRLQDFWYNKTDDKWYGLISGSSIHKGTRTHVYLAQSEDLNFTGDFGDSLLYCRDEWESGSWTDAGIYPPNVVWLNGRGFGGVKGYANPARPYDFDSDLIFMDSPRDISKKSFLSSLDSKDAYYNSILGFNDTQRSVPVLQDGILWMMVRNGVSWDAVGYVFQMTGYWANETVTISPGYNPLYHYDNLPTKDEFNSMMDVTVYVWEHEAKVTVNHIQGGRPNYAKLQIQGTSGHEVIIHFNELKTETVYLHIKSDKDVDILTITDVEKGSEQSLIPDINGDILFSYIIN